MRDALRELDEAPTIPAPPCQDAEGPPSLVVPRLTDRLYEEALAAAEMLEASLEGSGGGLESLVPASAPLGIACSFTVALLEIRRDAERAERALEKVLARAPELSEAHYHLGVLRLKRGDAHRAKASFRLAVETLARTRGELPQWAESLRRVADD